MSGDDTRDDEKPAAADPAAPERSRKLLADLEEQIARSRMQLAVMWCALENMRERRPTPLAGQALVDLAGGSAGPQGSGIDVLIVDDDEDLLGTLSDLLRWEGYTVVTVPGGREALAYLRTHARPSALVVDLMMPGMSGAELLQQLSTMEPERDIPVVVYTAANFQYIEAAGIDPKVVVRKNSLTGLLERLSSTVRRPPAAP
jgi:CheY-like chemotaxis protein